MTHFYNTNRNGNRKKENNVSDYFEQTDENFTYEISSALMKIPELKVLLIFEYKEVFPEPLGPANILILF